MSLVKSGPSTLMLAGLLYWMTQFADKKIDHALTVLEEHAAAGRVIGEAQVQQGKREAAFELASLQIQVATCKDNANRTATAETCESILRAWRWQYGRQYGQ